MTIFGYNVALSRDGDTLAVGAVNEDSSATGINGDMNDNSGVDSGAVYLFPAIPGSGLFLASDAYIKPSNTEASAVEFFAASLALSGNVTPWRWELSGKAVVPPASAVTRVTTRPSVVELSIFTILINMLLPLPGVAKRSL